MPFVSNMPSKLKRGVKTVLVALVLSFLSFAIVFLEYGVLNFGDSDLPPYQPDTLIENSFDAVWWAVTIATGLSWLYAIALALIAFQRFWSPDAGATSTSE